MIKTRNTNQKQLILETIKCLDHPTCDEIYEEVKKQDSNIGRATVFRNVKALTDMGKLTKINMPQGALRYDTSPKNHSHFVCTNCGQIYDVSYQPNIDLPSSSLYDVEGYELIFTGICKKCQEKKG